MVSRLGASSSAATLALAEPPTALLRSAQSRVSLVARFGKRLRRIPSDYPSDIAAVSGLARSSHVARGRAASPRWLETGEQTRSCAHAQFCARTATPRQRFLPGREVRVSSQVACSRSKRPAGCPRASASREWADGLAACKRASRRRGHTRRPTAQQSTTNASVTKPELVRTGLTPVRWSRMGRRSPSRPAQ
jgi:hypothetical protein